MSNVLSKEKRLHVLAVGRRDTLLRRTEKTTVVCRETASGLLEAAGVPVRTPRKGAGVLHVPEACVVIGYQNENVSTKGLFDQTIVVNQYRTRHSTRIIVTNDTLRRFLTDCNGLHACDNFCTFYLLQQLQLMFLPGSTQPIC